MITFMQFIIALYGLFKAVKEQRGEQSLQEFIYLVDESVRKSKEAQTDAEKVEAAVSLVACLKRLG